MSIAIAIAAWALAFALAKYRAALWGGFLISACRPFSRRRRARASAVPQCVPD
jgi:hypothetical protein